MLLLIATAIVAVAIFGLIIYARWHYGELESVGIPVAKPYFILGSDPNIHKVVVHELDLERFRKLGPIWGAYEGRKPLIFIADAEISRQILIKDFNNFRDRRRINFGHELMNETIDMQPYDPWKVLRTYFTPAFTTGKIRAMSNKIEEAVRDCVAHIDRQVGCGKEKNLDAKKIFIALTTDVLARCVFGMHLNSVNDPDNEFVKYTADLVGDAEDPPWTTILAMTFPILTQGLQLFPIKALMFFGDIIRNVMKTRREQKSLQNDMIDTFNELLAKVDTEEFKKLNIGEPTIISQALTFLFAGFETTATTLTMLAYNLGNNPDKQQKLIDELEELMEKSDGKLTHDNLADLPYMNACISETLRLVSPLVRIERLCRRDWKHPESGLVIKKGWTVILPNYALHRNEKYWPDPEKFIPERFMPENKDNLNPYAYNAFGQGPRNCVGMRFAKEELIFSLALILKDFTFQATEESKIKFKKGRLFLAQYEPVMVNLVRRQK